eukprot:19147-Heterococcus_DN1.PRE.2
MQQRHIAVATCIPCALHTLVYTNCQCLYCYHLRTQQFEKARALADKQCKQRRTSTATAATRRGTNATENGDGDDSQQEEVQALEDVGLAITMAACNKLWRPSARAAAVAAPGNNDDNQGGGGGNGHNGHDAPPPPPANDDNNNNNDHHNAGAGG